MRGLLKASAGIQAASVLTLILQNLLAPRLMGAASYGRAVGLMALPLLLQGVIEPMVNGVAITARSRSDRFRIVRQSLTYLGLLLLPVAAVTLAYGIERRATPWQLVLLGSFVVLVMVNTALRGLAFAGRRHGLLVAHFVAAGFATVATLPFLVLFETTGYLAMMCFVQAAVLGVLLGDRQLRTEVASTVAEQHGSGGTFDFMRICAANLAPRAAQVALGPGMLLLASVQLEAVRLAEFRVAQTFAGALSYALPLHPTLIQAHASSAGAVAANPGSSEVRSFVRLFILSAGLAMVETLALWLVYPWGTAFLLKRDVVTYEFRSMIWAAPFFALSPAISGLLLGTGSERVVLLVNLLLIPASAAVGVRYGAAAGFAGGSVALGCALGIAAWWCYKKVCFGR